MQTGRQLSALGENAFGRRRGTECASEARMSKPAHQHASARRARELLTRQFGHVDFQPGQWDAIRAMLD
jgi:hypothetical protein